MRRYRVIQVFIFCICVLSCNDEAEECPYNKIRWTNETQEVRSESKIDFKVNLGGELDSCMRKIGKGKLNASIKNQLESISNEISSGSIKHDEKFVQKWNILVEDICGKLKLLEFNLSDSTKLELEKEILNSVKLFHNRLMTLENNQNVIEVKDNISKEEKTTSIPKSFFEISIHLEKKYKGYSDVFVNGEKALILPSSTDTNLRIFLERKADERQSILIITGTKDTCEIFGLFEDKESLPIRFIPNCTTKL